MRQSSMGLKAKGRWLAPELPGAGTSWVSHKCVFLELSLLLGGGKSHQCFPTPHSMERKGEMAQGPQEGTSGATHEPHFFVSMLGWD